MANMTEDYCPDVCCNNCVVGSYDLIDSLVNDIQLLASEVVRLRYMLSFHLPKHIGKMVRVEICSDLHGVYYEYPIYQDYISFYHNGEDPFDSDKYCNHLLKLSEGEESADEYRSLTF